jgi:hypothetical protein
MGNPQYLSGHRRGDGVDVADMRLAVIIDRDFNRTVCDRCNVDKDRLRPSEPRHPGCDDTEACNPDDPFGPVWWHG